MNMVHKYMFQENWFLGIILFLIFVLFSSSGCGSKQNDHGLKSTKNIVLNYLKRLKSKDESLLAELNSITSENFAVNGWIGEYEGQRGFYVQFENLSDKSVFMHRPDYSVYSSMYEKGGKNWVGINLVVYPGLPYVILPHTTLKLHFPFVNSLPEDINLQVTFSLPQYTNIANDGELKYSEYRLIRQFTITRGEKGEGGVFQRN